VLLLLLLMVMLRRVVTFQRRVTVVADDIDLISSANDLCGAGGRKNGIGASNSWVTIDDITCS
jgi:hypothetical protein